MKKVNKEDRMIELLEELVKWMKVTSIPKVKELLLGILESPEERVAYQFSNGKKTVREVAKQANVGTGTISRWWKKWEKVAIADSISAPRGKRAKRVFSLQDFGIDVPELTVANTDEDSGEEET